MAYTTYKGNQHHTCQRSHICQYVQQFQNQKKKLQTHEGAEMRSLQQLSTESEPENEEFAVYVCPGLASTGELEIHNPLFNPLRNQ
ncbi:hypothetical protein FKM82_023753 [Ascaphus truei]